ncbi:MAG TPA: hypothetical protein VMP01_15105 [Pirellulaceae bacterium]|nr:hypothetical protein [Pirellulaceae bacterium]
MLFSNDQVASVINEQFEPAWQSLRPVPRVTIDFGNGTVVKRTLHGNVATYVCTPDGKVLDILPGIYEPKTYARELRRLARQFDQWQQPGFDSAAHWQAYHRSQTESAKRMLASPGKSAASGRGASIFATERPTRRTIRGERPPNLAAASTSLSDSLAEDTLINQTTRRRKIHERLVKSGPVTPDEISKWLYREVLGTDLDDPYLGLKEMLFKNYPFVEEDAED